MSTKKITFAGIDDSKMNRMIFEETATILKADVIIASDGLDGLNQIINSVEANIIPDVIITDINMPNMNGIELIAKLKSNPATKYIPILVLTTETDFNVKMQGKNLGAAGWITKPLDPEEIAKIILKFLKK
ncbi:MAG: hypothetical protein A2504_02580 [Bdellovibrionales bacterium RIFOXYD12_FULL_39_22]|nr:MAG: hypothetical protein A2385_12610 [Bdellovibrionales bacterium RIFOXYB1_FULL_39_21]OFZ41190.1 MAG: hypothetical protein A2485_01020 [Bdellovibrionales bacterium RIFOXYC12_FULL_39_17]OFZ44944.1 MAG: hypothetical protein A2404_11765 [Bdellovibrionales bacterium RIFOXYC1_FULL_39_130]OFZ74391.1 MAG: hypothetical protein A2560_12135 [Bdellovibrionales bacterium RIFOXYD1_FULL_39_84]OFZ74713.1 MAG: hypothetical protein A2451_09885 [Bdellovibrionales bacterium RIFOXYC2_FULL_39_8]OFZ92393.1 MAG: